MAKMIKCTINSGYTFRAGEGADRETLTAGDEVEVSETTFQNLKGVFTPVPAAPTESATKDEKKSSTTSGQKTSK